MTTTHTPGPWTIEADPDKAGLHPLHDNRYVGSERGWVCALRDQPEQAADARLIAAAPDLLAALKAASGNIDDCGMSLEAYGNLIDQIDAAIAKAEEG